MGYMRTLLGAACVFSLSFTTNTAHAGSFKQTAAIEIISLNKLDVEDSVDVKVINKGNSIIFRVSGNKNPSDITRDFEERTYNIGNAGNDTFRTTTNIIAKPKKIVNENNTEVISFTQNTTVNNINNIYAEIKIEKIAYASGASPELNVDINYD